MAETHKRTWMKGIVYRIGAFIITLIVCKVFTGEWWESIEIAGVVMAIKTLWYWRHERFWKDIHWGYIKEEIKERVPNDNEEVN